MIKLDKFKVPKDFRGKNILIIQLWWLFDKLFFQTSPQFMYFWRNFLLRLFGANIGNNVKIRPSAKIIYPWNLFIGNNSWIGDDTKIYNLDHIIIGSNVCISHHVFLNTGSHDYKMPNFKILKKRIVIHDSVWIASEVFVNLGVTINKNIVVGCKSLVLKDLKLSGVYAGAPVKKINDI